MLRERKTVEGNRPRTPRPKSEPRPLDPAAAQLPDLPAGVSPNELWRSLAKGGGKKPRANKFGAVKTNGYDSKAEAKYAEHLATLKRAGAIVDWLEQVPIRLQDGPLPEDRITYRLDFLVIENARIRLVEVKGFETKEWKLKKQLLRKLRPELYALLEVVK